MTQKAVEMGRKAAAAGKPITANPYTKPGAWLRWRRGYEAENIRKVTLTGDRDPTDRSVRDETLP